MTEYRIRAGSASSPDADPAPAQAGFGTPARGGLVSERRDEPWLVIVQMPRGDGLAAAYCAPQPGPTIPAVEPLHSTLFDRVGAVASIGFAGFIGGFFGSSFVFLFTDRWINPVEAGEHMSAWVGLLAIGKAKSVTFEPVKQRAEMEANDVRDRRDVDSAATFEERHSL